jgi:hypothetical protein
MTRTTKENFKTQEQLREEVRLQVERYEVGGALLYKLALHHEYVVYRYTLCIR